MLVIGTTVAFIASVRTPALGSRPELAEASDDGEADAGGDLEKANALCGNCYKMNLCSKLALGNYSDEKQACLCDGVGPDAQKACQVQCAQSGPEPVGEIKLMPCGKSACNRCSRNCGGGNYWANPGTIANWKYSPTYTSGKTWSRVSGQDPSSRGAAHVRLLDKLTHGKRALRSPPIDALCRDTASACDRTASRCARV